MDGAMGRAAKAALAAQLSYGALTGRRERIARSFDAGNATSTDLVEYAMVWRLQAARRPFRFPELEPAAPTVPEAVQPNTIASAALRFKYRANRGFDPLDSNLLTPTNARQLISNTSPTSAVAATLAHCPCVLQEESVRVLKIDLSGMRYIRHRKLVNTTGSGAERRHTFDRPGHRFKKLKTHAQFSAL